jgi:broad specificity phosphatase PhoE
MTTTIHLVRHGEVHNPEDIYYGRIPGYRLSERGREQAAAAGKFLANKPLVAIYASPQQRAQETAEIIAAPHDGLGVQSDERLDEVYTPWDGAPSAKIASRDFDMYTDSRDEYEQPIDIFHRVQSFTANIRRLYEGKAIAAVSHGDILVFMFMFAVHVELTPKNKLDLKLIGFPEEYPVTASVISLTYRTDEPDEVPRWKYIKPY